MSFKKALLIVDVQNDFLPPNGSLAVPRGEEVIPLINDIRERGDWDVIVLTQDYHPESHVSFITTHLKSSSASSSVVNKPVLFRHYKLPDGTSQIMWPEHCVWNTFGSMFHKNLHRSSKDYVVQKGLLMDVDSYSGFFDNNRTQATKLNDILVDNSIKEIFICGLAYDYCVGFTALDGASLGYRTHVIADGTRAVSNQSADEMTQRLKESGVRLLQSSQLNLKAPTHPMVQTSKYLSNHGIEALFQRLMTKLVYFKPDSPLEFLIEQLEKEKSESKEDNTLLTQTEIEILFSELDTMKRGSVNTVQALEMLKSFGITKMPASSQLIAKEKINKEEFVALVNNGS